MTAPERGNLRANGNGANATAAAKGEGDRSAFQAAIEQMERVRTNLRDIMGDLGDAIAALKAAEKEQRASAKEIQAIRAKLKEIQSVAL